MHWTIVWGFSPREIAASSKFVNGYSIMLVVPCSVIRPKELHVFRKPSCHPLSHSAPTGGLKYNCPAVANVTSVLVFSKLVCRRAPPVPEETNILYWTPPRRAWQLGWQPPPPRINLWTALCSPSIRGVRTGCRTHFAGHYIAYV